MNSARVIQVIVRYRSRFPTGLGLIRVTAIYYFIVYRTHSLPVDTQGWVRREGVGFADYHGAYPVDGAFSDT